MMRAWCSAVEMVHVHGRKERYFGNDCEDERSFVDDCGDDECCGDGACSWKKGTILWK